MTDMAACIDKIPLFESAHYADHEQAKALCHKCPRLEACKLEKPGEYTGTWAGVYYHQGRAIRTAERPKMTQAEAAAIAWAADVVGIGVGDLCSRDRLFQRERLTACYLLREHRNMALTSIGRMVRRDHTTIGIWVRQVRADEAWAAEAESLRCAA